MGYRFKTNSDTEVIIYAYHAWGNDCVKRFNGVWSFALWDKTRKILFCSRDRLGEKPFFYSYNNDRFVFASEIKALFEFGVPRYFAWELLDIYLCLTYIPSPVTFFKDVHQLMPGYSLIVDQGRMRIFKYWDIDYPDDRDLRRDEDRIVSEFREIFYDAVRLRMRCDVDYGAFLSGGLDSGSIVAVMSNYAKTPIKTCTIGFSEKTFDERFRAKLMAEKYHTDHVEQVVDRNITSELMRKLSWHYDQPFGDSSALPTYFLSRVAKGRVKMCLSGDGGDEVLSGYTIYQGEKFSRYINRLPRSVRINLLEKGLTRTKYYLSGGLKSRVRYAEAMVKKANMDFVARLIAKQSGLTESNRNRLIVNPEDQYPVRDYIAETIKPVEHKSNFTKLDYWLLKVSLPDDMLCKADRATMANSLEVRTPFLDHRIVELLASVHVDVKLKGFTRKNILRLSMGKMLPRKILNAGKHGFTMPLRLWLQEEGDSFLVEQALFSSDTGYVKRAPINDLVNEHRAGLNDASGALWSLAMLAYVVQRPNE
jgi:asparagine synthase (glutamine-hydrolysing)